MHEDRSIKKILGPALILMAGAFILYANTFGNAWTLDDYPVIVNNPDVRSLGGFLKDAYPGRPLRELTFLLDHSLFGLQPFGYHFQNIFWHGLNAGLVFALALRLGGGRLLAWTAALLFLAHPVQVEVVANISHRKDSLALAFSLLSLLAYTQAFAAQRKKGLWMAVAALLAGVAFTAKQNALALPLVFCAYEAAFLSPEERFLLRRKGVFISLLAAGMVAALAWFWAFGGQERYLEALPGVMAKMNQGFDGVEPYCLLVLKSWTFMFLKLLAPVNLAAEYLFAVPEWWGDPWVLSTLGICLLYGASLFLVRSRAPLVFLALVWAGALWLPTSNLWPFSYFAADRYLYAPSVGFFLVFAALLKARLARIPSARIALLAALVVVLSLLTWRQNGVWHSRMTLWGQAVKVNPESTTALNNLGSVYKQRGELQKALEYYKRAADNFNDPMPYFNLGEVYEELGNRDKALFYYRNFLAFNDPRYRGKAMGLRQRIYRKYGVILK